MTLVVEDSLYALQTAGKAGSLTAGIYDALGEPDQEQLKKGRTYLLPKSDRVTELYIYRKRRKRKMKTALTIAGSDSSGGAGIQADIKTMMANGVYAMSAITALTAQNTTGVAAIQNATAEFLGQELDSIFTDIFPDAVKIGMVSESDLIRMIAKKAPAVSGEKYHSGSGYGGYQRRKADQ